MAVPFLNGIDLKNQPIINVADPSANTDAANKQYVDNVARGLSWKTPARVATTANIDLAAVSSVDGVTLSTDDRVLVKNQTDATENGIYYKSNGGLTRTSDTIAPNTALSVSEGSTQADTVWHITSDEDIVVGTTNIVFSQLGGGVEYQANGGLTLTNYTFSVKTGNGIGIDGASATQAVGNGSKSVSVDVSGIGVNVKADGLVEHSGTDGLNVRTGSGIDRTGNTLAVRPKTTDGALTVDVNGVSVNVDTTKGLAKTSNQIGAKLGTGLNFDGSGNIQVDAGVVARTKWFSVGDGTSTSITVTHNFNTRDVTVDVYENSGTYTTVYTEVERPTVNTVVLKFAVAPSTNQYRVNVRT